jgi:hypothetical protein
MANCSEEFPVGVNRQHVAVNTASLCTPFTVAPVGVGAGTNELEVGGVDSIGASRGPSDAGTTMTTPSPRAAPAKPTLSTGAA